MTSARDPNAHWGRSFGILTEKEIDGSEALIRERTGNRSLVLFDSGDEVTVQAGEEGIRLLLVSRKPLREPVAWYGPIVMNTCNRRPASFGTGPSSRAAEPSFAVAVASRPWRFHAPEVRTKSRNRCPRASILFVAFRPSGVEHPTRNTGDLDRRDKWQVFYKSGDDQGG